MQIRICGDEEMGQAWVEIPEVLFFQEGPGVRNTQYTTEGVKLLNVANLVDGRIDLATSDRYISEDEANGKYSHFLCDVGDFIVASSGIKVEYIDKKMGFVEESMLPLCMNTSTIRFKVLDKNRLNIRYFMYYLKSQHFKGQLVRQITGSAQLNYGPSHLKKMIMPLVDISLQDEIIQKLDKVHNIINARQKELNILDDLIKSRFVEMFGDPETNTKGWPIVNMCDLCSVGSSKRIYQSEQSSEGVPFWRISDLTNLINTGVVTGNLYIPEKRYAELQDQGQVPAKDDILVTSRGTLGQCYIVKADDKFYFQDGMISWLSQYAEGITPLYISYLFSMSGFRKQIDSMQAGSTVAYLSIAMIKKLKVMVPDEETQQHFAAFVHQVDKLKVAVQKALDKTQVLFDSLMQQYFG